MAFNVPTKAGLDLLRRMSNASAAAKYNLSTSATQAELEAAHRESYANRPLVK